MVSEPSGGRAEPTSRSTVRCVILCGIALLTVWATYSAGLQRGMATSVSTRHAYYSLPYAVSSGQFGTTGYVILRDVAKFFIDAIPNISNETVAQAAQLSPSREPMYFPGDDKGDADFVILAFRLFGAKVESLYRAWFALFVTGILLFMAFNWGRESRLAALCVLTLAVYVAFFVLPLTRELASVQNPRVFGVVSLVSVLQLSFAMIDRRPLTWLAALACLPPALLIALTVHVRTPESWQALAVFGVAAWLLVWWRPRPALRCLWPAAVLLLALIGLNVYQRASLDPVYAATHLQHRTMWHNVGVGFALNPELARRYQLTLDDLPMITLIRRHLTDNNRADEIDRIFRPAGEEDYKFSGIAKDFAGYERLAREVVFSIAWNNKGEAIQTFLVDKPRVLFRQLMWAAGYQRYSLDELFLSGQFGSVTPDSERVKHSVYLDLFRPWVLAGLLATALAAGASQPRSDDASFVALACWVAFASLLPAMLAYPTISTLGVVIVTIPAAVLAFALLGARWVLPVGRPTWAARSER